MMDDVYTNANETIMSLAPADDRGFGSLYGSNLGHFRWPKFGPLLARSVLRLAQGYEHMRRIAQPQDQVYLCYASIKELKHDQLY
jgi:hypothetical protein